MATARRATRLTQASSVSRDTPATARAGVEMRFEDMGLEVQRRARDGFLALAEAAAGAAGFDHFVPDACLINTYSPGARMALHQDKNERSFEAPIVSISLGLPAVFQFGGFERSDPTQRISLFHGDIVVWGGVDRLRYHGVLPIQPGHHPVLGEQRINITLRKAG